MLSVLVQIPYEVGIDRIGDKLGVDVKAGNTNSLQCRRAEPTLPTGDQFDAAQLLCVLEE